MTDLVYRRYTVYRLADGEIVSNLHAATAEDVASNTPIGHGAVEGEFVDGVIMAGQFAHYTPRQIAARAARPPYPAEWSNVAMAWRDLRGLEQLRADRWAELKERRKAAEEGGFVWDGSIFDSDSKSQARIQGAAMLVTHAPPGLTLDWTLADNTVRVLTGSDIIGVGVALAAHMAAQHATGASLRAALNAARTAGEVLAVAWPE